MTRSCAFPRPNGIHRIRRGGLLLCLGLILAGGVASAAGLTGPGLTLARLKYGGGGDWYSNPTSLPNLARALEERTSITIAQYTEARVSLADDELFDYPLLYTNGHGNIKLTSSEVDRLHQYLTQGGFLFADDNYGMDSSFRQMIGQVFPDRELVEIPFDHQIYHSFYEINNGPPKVHEHDKKLPQGLGIFDHGRLVLFYTYESDIGDGLEDPEIHNDPPEKREEAMRMAINIVVYALLGDR